jgi:hypothetical protein
LCGFLARVVGLTESADETSPSELVADFDWARISRDDALIRWRDGELSCLGYRPAETEPGVS